MGGRGCQHLSQHLADACGGRGCISVYQHLADAWVGERGCLSQHLADAWVDVAVYLNT